MTIQDLTNWHRTLGFIATIFILTLTLSGLVLNHADALRLDRIYIENEMILDWYGIAPNQVPVCFKAGSHRVTQIGQRLYLDEKELPDNPEELRGVVSSANFMVLAFTNSVFLLTEQGDMVEKLTRLQGLPGDIQGLGLGRGGQLLISTGTAVLSSDMDMQNWKPYLHAGGDWSVHDNLPRQLKKKLIRKYRGKGLSLEKLLLDLHSGRLFGQAGVYLVDLFAIIFIILGISGWWSWWKRRALQREINSSL